MLQVAASQKRGAGRGGRATTKATPKATPWAGRVSAAAGSEGRGSGRSGRAAGKRRTAAAGDDNGKAREEGDAEWPGSDGGDSEYALSPKRPARGSSARGAVVTHGADDRWRQRTLLGGQLPPDAVDRNLDEQAQRARLAALSDTGPGHWGRAAHSAIFSSRFTSQSTGTGSLEAYVASRSARPGAAGSVALPQNAGGSLLRAMARQTTIHGALAAQAAANAVPASFAASVGNQASLRSVRAAIANLGGSHALGHAIRGPAYASDSSFDSVLDGGALSDEMDGSSPTIVAAARVGACRFCGDDRQFAGDPILQCWGCGVCVHVGCYGVSWEELQMATARVQGTKAAAKAGVNIAAVSESLGLRPPPATVAPSTSAPSYLSAPAASAVASAVAAARVGGSLVDPVVAGELRPGGKQLTLALAGDVPGLAVEDGYHWLCNPCSGGLDTSRLGCCLCPVAGGPLKPVATAEAESFPSLFEKQTGRKPAPASSASLASPANPPSSSCSSLAEVHARTAVRPRPDLPDTAVLRPYPTGCLPPSVPADTIERLSRPGCWAHVTCAMYVPEVTVEDPVELAPVSGLERVAKDRWRYACRVCHTSKGAVAQCSFGSCGASFHPQCARDAGIQMQFRWNKAGNEGEFVLRCSRHDTRSEAEQASQTAAANLRHRELLHRSTVRRAEARRKQWERLTEVRRVLRELRRQRRAHDRERRRTHKLDASEPSVAKARQRRQRRAEEAVERTTRKLLSQKAAALAKAVGWARGRRGAGGASGLRGGAEDGSEAMAELDLLGELEEGEEDGEGGLGSDADGSDEGEWDGQSPIGVGGILTAEDVVKAARNSASGRFEWSASTVVNATSVRQAWPQLSPWFLPVGPATLRSLLGTVLTGRRFEGADAPELPLAIASLTDGIASARVHGSSQNPAWASLPDTAAAVGAITAGDATFAAAEAAVVALESELPIGEAGAWSVDAHPAEMTELNRLLCPASHNYPDSRWPRSRLLEVAAALPSAPADFGPGKAEQGELEREASVQYRRAGSLLPYLSRAESGSLGHVSWSSQPQGLLPCVAQESDLSTVELPRYAAAGLSARRGDDEDADEEDVQLVDEALLVPRLGRWYRDVWADEDVDQSLVAGASSVAGAQFVPLREAGSLPNATDLFCGFGDGDGFSHLRRSYAVSKKRTSVVEQFAETAKRRGVCSGTTFRFATSDDAEQIARANRVNPAYPTAAAFRHTIEAKNEFTIVATRSGICSEPSAQVVGFVNYYFMWFRVMPQFVDITRLSLQALAEQGTAAAVPTQPNSERLEPEPVAYVASLQAVKRATHADIMGPHPAETRPIQALPSSSPLTTASPEIPWTAAATAAPAATASAELLGSPPATPPRAIPARPSTPPSASRLHPQGIVLPSVPAGAVTSDAGPPNPGAQKSTGTLLMLLACRHAAANGIRWMLVDSTSEAVPYYAGVMGFEQRGPLHHPKQLAAVAHLSPKGPPAWWGKPPPDSPIRTIQGDPLRSHQTHYTPMRLYLPTLDPYAIIASRPTSSALVAAAAAASQAGVGGAIRVPRHPTAIDDEITGELEACRAQLCDAARAVDSIASGLLLRLHQREAAHAAMEDRIRAAQSAWRSWKRRVEVIRKEREEAARRAEEDDNATCGVCGGGMSHPRNQVIFCDSCNLAVHQQCVGLPIVPDGQWFCDCCAAAIGRETMPEGTPPPRHSHSPRDVQCVMCPVRGGCLKPTDQAEGARKWVHIMCAKLHQAAPQLQPLDPADDAAMAATDSHRHRLQWLSHEVGWRGTLVSFGDQQTLKPVQGLGSIEAESGQPWLQVTSGKRPCDVCGLRYGVVVPCCRAAECGGWVHAMCAAQRGLITACWPGEDKMALTPAPDARSDEIAAAEAAAAAAIAAAAAAAAAAASSSPAGDSRDSALVQVRSSSRVAGARAGRAVVYGRPVQTPEGVFTSAEQTRFATASEAGILTRATAADGQPIIARCWTSSIAGPGPEAVACALDLSTVSAHTMLLEGNGGTGEADAATASSLGAWSRQGALGAQVRTSVVIQSPTGRARHAPALSSGSAEPFARQPRGSARPPEGSGQPPLLIFCPRCRAPSVHARDLSTVSRAAVEREVLEAQSRKIGKGKVTASASQLPLQYRARYVPQWRRKADAGGGKGCIWDGAWMEVNPQLVEAECGAVVPRSRTRVHPPGAGSAVAAAHSGMDARDGGDERSGAVELAAAVESLATPAEREAAAMVMDAVVARCRDVLRMRAPLNADELQVQTAAAVRKAASLAATGAIDKSEISSSSPSPVSTSLEVSRPRWSQLQSTARARAVVRRVCRTEALQAVRAAAEAACVGPSPSDPAAAAEAAAAAATAATESPSSPRPLELAANRGAGILFAYASGLKLSLQAVQRKVEVCLPYGIAPASTVPAAIITDHGSHGKVVETADEEDEDAPICVCRKPWSHDTSFALCCSSCNEWYHAKCINLEQVDDDHVREAETGRVIDVSGSWDCPRCANLPGKTGPRKRARQDISIATGEQGLPAPPAAQGKCSAASAAPAPASATTAIAALSVPKRAKAPEECQGNGRAAQRAKVGDGSKSKAITDFFKRP